MEMTGWEANEEVQGASAGRKGKVNGKNKATSEQTHLYLRGFEASEWQR